MVGTCEVVGAADGFNEMEGDGLGANDGINEIVGLEDGMCEIEGLEDGLEDGLREGMNEIVGLEDGMCEMEGLDDGLEDGASLCGRAPSMTKSDAVAAAALATAWTFSTLMVAAIAGGISPLPSKFMTEIPLTSYFPGAITESAMT